MDEIRIQVSRARRRLVLQQFLDIFTWTLLAGMLVAVVGVAIPKIWPIAVDARIWAAGWIGGGVLGALLLAIVLTYVIRRNALDAAIELDRRYGLKERVSSTLSLTSDEATSEVGQALVDDASRRVARIDVREHFHISPRWQVVFSLLPALAAVCLLFLQNAVDRTGEAKAKEDVLAQQEQVKKANDALKKRLEKQQQEQVDKDKNLKNTDLELLLKKMEGALNELEKKEGIDKKDALVKLNDLKKELEEQRKKVGGAENAQKQLNQLKDLQQGPADKLAEALKDGDFNEAVKQLQDLAEKMENGELTPEDKQKLVDQLNDMKEKLEKMANDHKQAKKDLEDQIKQAEQQGDQAKAEKLKQELAQLQQQNEQMERLQQMANKLGQCSKCMQQGDGKAAAQQLSDMMNDLQEMQADLDELQSLDELMDALSDAKNSMNCKNCDGDGCAQCMGMGRFGMNQQQFGNGLGEGQGQGDRPEEATDTSAYDTNVKSKPKAGEAAITGVASGPNRKGLSREEVKQEIESSLREESDPTNNEALPRALRDQSREYFENLRGGKS